MCLSAVFSSVLVKYSKSSFLFLLASGINSVRHEVLNSSQLALLRFQLGVLLFSLFILFCNRMGKWSLLYVLSLSWNRLRSHIVKSITEYVPVAGWRYVFDSLMYMRNWFLFNSDYIILPFLSVFLLPQISLWLLKSTIIMKGLGNCSIKLFNSDSLISSLGGIYIEHTVIVLWRVADITAACRLVFSLISLCGILLFMFTDELPQRLSVGCLI